MCFNFNFNFNNTLSYQMTKYLQSQKVQACPFDKI